MTKKLEKKPEVEVFVRHKFPDGDVKMPLQEWTELEIRGYIRALKSDDPRLSEIGQKGLFKLASSVSEATRSNLIQKKGRKRANELKKAEADRKALDEFIRWREKIRPTLYKDGEPLSFKDQVRKFKIAKRPGCDSAEQYRKAWPKLVRRLNALVKDGKIPSLK